MPLDTEQTKRAVAVVFPLNGLAFASWVSRMPSVRDGLDLTAGQVGLLLLCLSAGTLVALPLSGPVVERVGPARTVRVAALAAAAGLAVMAGGLATGSVAAVAAGMFGYGVGTSAWDVAMNVEAADVERRLGRTIMPRFHAGFSLGTVLGALAGAACARADVSLTVQLVATATAVVAVVPVSVRRFQPLLPPQDRSAPGPGALRAWTEPRTLLLGLMVLAFALVEGIANDWIALAVVDGLGTSEAVGAAAFGTFVAAMTLGRLLGGSVVDRLGRVAALRSTAALAGAGVALLVLSPGLAGALAGAACWGLGASLGFPLGMTAAAEDESRAAARVSVVSSIGYAAFLGGPPVVGLVADRVGVRDAVLVAVAAAGLALALSGAARRTRAQVVVDGR